MYNSSDITSHFSLSLSLSLSATSTPRTTTTTKTQTKSLTLHKAFHNNTPLLDPPYSSYPQTFPVFVTPSLDVQSAEGLQYILYVLCIAQSTIMSIVHTYGAIMCHFTC